MSQSKTYIATPPGETIKEQLQDRGMQQKEFAVRMNLSEKHVSRLINGEVHLTPDMAVKLEMVFAVPAAFWNKLEAIYREKLAKVRDENSLENEFALAKRFPYQEMANLGWVPKVTGMKERVIRLRQFFEVVTLYLINSPAITPIIYRRQSVSEKASYALLAWAQQAKREARKIVTAKINQGKLESMLPTFRQLTTEVPQKFCPRLEEMLATCGIAIIFLPHIKGSFLHGATFRVGNKIVLGLTVRGKYADKFWFSFFHELAHILHGDVFKQEGVEQEDEDKADFFAEEKLIPNDAFFDFTAAGDFSRESILKFANRIGISAAIVVGRLQQKKIIHFSAHNDLRPQYVIP